MVSSDTISDIRSFFVLYFLELQIYIMSDNFTVCFRMGGAWTEVCWLDKPLEETAQLLPTLSRYVELL